MADKLEEDVRALLDSGVGDKRVLEQILRAVVNGELLSNQERNYVRSLTEEHLNKEPAVEAVPDAAAYVVESKSKPKPESAGPRNNRTLIIAVAAAAVALAVTAAASTMFMGDSEPAVIVVDDPVPDSAVTQDSEAYRTGDFIVIEGFSDYPPGDMVRLHILDSAGRQIWSEEVTVKADGSYSTLVLAGGDGWTPGIHTIEAVHGDDEYRSEYSFTD